MEEMSEEVVKLSKINSASLINMRIHNIWLEVNKAAVSGNYPHWNSNLDRIWCELGGDIKESKKNKEGKEEKSQDIIKFNELDKDVSEKLSKLKIKEGFSKINSDDKKNMSEAYNSLIKKEFFLRKLQNTQGKGTAYEESWDDYIHG